jgi:hypothetical protein
VHQVRLANYLDSWKVPDSDGGLDPGVRKMVRGSAGVPAAPLGQRPAWAFERGEEASSPEADDVCQRIPGQLSQLSPLHGTIFSCSDSPCLCICVCGAGHVLHPHCQLVSLDSVYARCLLLLQCFTMHVCDAGLLHG